MRDEALVGQILRAVVGAVKVPVTLKMRTGWARAHRNAVTIARVAEDCGIAALTIHGRTREDHYSGDAEYETLAAVRACIRIPLIANGDVDGGEKARRVLSATGADALMIGRAALGRPWIFREIAGHLDGGRRVSPPRPDEIATVLLGHVRELHRFYGEVRGVRVARKHIQWYCQSHPGAGEFWATINRVESASEQIEKIEMFFAGWPDVARLAA